MFRYDEVTEEGEKETIRKVAKMIHERGMEMPAILFLETLKPLAYIGGQMARIFVSPFTLLFGEGFSQGGENILATFQKMDNVEKLIVLLEEKAQEKSKKKEKEKQTGAHANPLT